MATCPECDAEIEVDDDDIEEMEVGDRWDCGECGSRLRVSNLDPLEYEPDDEDDDQDDDDDDEDDDTDDSDNSNYEDDDYEDDGDDDADDDWDD